MITQREVSQIVFQKHKLDKVIEKDYVITWILLGLTRSKLKESLAFKGGTALKRIYFPDYRYSEDLDFTVVTELDEADLKSEFIKVLRDLERSQAFVFDLKEEKIERHTDSLTFYVDFVGPLQARLGSRDIKIDFTLIEKLLYPSEEKIIKAPYSDCKGFSRRLKTYTLEEILAEKLCALIGRTEPRDLYDAHFLLEWGNLDYHSVGEGFKVKALSKKIDSKRLRNILREKEATIARLWEIRLAHQVDELPHLEAVTRKTNKYLRQYGIV